MTRKTWLRRLWAVVLIVMAGSAGIAGQERDVAPVTDAMLQSPDPAPGSAQGFPITYAVQGRQFLAVPVGGDRSNAIYVFALPPDRP